MTRIVVLLVQALLIAIINTGCGGEAQNEKQSEKIRELESRLSKLENETSNGNAPSNNFKEVRIANQIWMAENLNVGRFRNGDIIPHVKDNEEWTQAGINKQPAWCYYDNDPTNKVKYGKLYNWYAVNDPRGLAPHGWHIPNIAEWDVLTNLLDDEQVGAGGKMKSEGTRYWKAPNCGRRFNGCEINASNESGFTGLPGGFRDVIGIFKDINIQGSWWSSSQSDLDEISRMVLAKGITLRNYHGTCIKDSYIKSEGISVRCLKD